MENKEMKTYNRGRKAFMVLVLQRYGLQKLTMSGLVMRFYMTTTDTLAHLGKPSTSGCPSSDQGVTLTSLITAGLCTTFTLHNSTTMVVSQLFVILVMFASSDDNFYFRNSLVIFLDHSAA